jgi:hypothetical protein
MYLRGFSAKTVIGIIILKSGLLENFFSLGWQPGEQHALENILLKP